MLDDLKRSHNTLILLAAIYAGAGAASSHIAQSPADTAALTFALGFPTAIAFFSWCKFDTAERGVTSPAPASMLVGLLAPIGMPYYLFATRSFGPALWGLSKAVAYLAAINLLYTGTKLMALHFV